MGRPLFFCRIFAQTATAMQLLYLWIEKYKNIENQGFNFSPLHRFHFEPSKDPALKGGTLTDEISKEERKKLSKVYNGFFGNAISNVTAIVGKNGSGKSNIGEFIERALYASDRRIGNMFLVFLKDDKIYYFHSYEEGQIVIDIQAYKLENLHFSKFYLMEYPVRPKQLKEILWIRYNTNFITKPYAKSGVLKENIVHVHPAIWLNHEKSDTKSLINLFNQRLILFVKAARTRGINMLFDAPLDVSFEISYTIKTVEQYFSEYFEENNDKNRIDQIKQILLKLYISSTSILNIDKNNLNSYIYDFFSDKFLYGILMVLVIRGIKIAAINNDHIIELLSSDNTIKDKIYIMLSIEYIDTNAPYLIQKTKQLINKLEEIVSQQNFTISLSAGAKESDSFSLKIDIGTNVLPDKAEQFFNFITTYLEAEAYNFIEIDYPKLSQGEKYLLTLYSFIFEFYKNPIPINDIKEIIVFIDEGDIGLHPKWQKQFLHNLLHVLPQIFPDKKIQLILTTHSPFLVSDLPKENIIFLDRDKDGQCFAADLSSKKATFGANIHTLFADSFFMENGLMGEFAKSKLHALAKRMDDVSANTESEEIEKIQAQIDMIGEPFLREQFQRKLDEKYNSSDAFIRQRLRELEREQESLKSKLNRKDNDSN